MRKITLLISLFVISFSITAIKKEKKSDSSLIATNEINKFTKDRIIKTEGVATVQWFWMVEGYIEFMATNDVPILKFYYCPEIKLSFPNGAKLSLLDDKDSVYVFICPIGGYAASFPFIGDFENIINKNIVQYRLEGGAQVYEGTIHKQKRTAFSDLYLSIKNEILKYYPGGVKILTDDQIELVKKFL
jgi:hypothetical protein